MAKEKMENYIQGVFKVYPDVYRAVRDGEVQPRVLVLANN
jgi:hypothetical protein